MSAVLMLIVKEVAPAIIGPLVTWLVKLLMAKFDKSIPALGKIAISAAAGAMTAATTGDVSSLGAAVSDVVTGGIAGVAGSKARDIVMGKPEVMSSEKLLELMGRG